MDAARKHFPYEYLDPCRPLDWRWQKAQALTASGRRLTSRRADPEIKDAVKYLRKLNRCESKAEQSRLTRKWPALRAAQQLHGCDDPLRWAVEARILAGQTDETIAQACSLSAETVHQYEALFFHVRDRLQARDWIAAHVIGSGLWRGFAQGDLASIWRMFGYFCGAFILETVMAVTQDLPFPDSLRASFRVNPRFEEASLRLVTRLAIESRLAQPSIPWPTMGAIYAELVQLRMEELGTDDVDFSMIAPMFAVLDLAVRSTLNMQAKSSVRTGSDRNADGLAKDRGRISDEIAATTGQPQAFTLAPSSSDAAEQIPLHVNEKGSSVIKIQFVADSTVASTADLAEIAGAEPQAGERVFSGKYTFPTLDEFFGSFSRLRGEADFPALNDWLATENGASPKDPRDDEVKPIVISSDDIVISSGENNPITEE